MLNYNIDVSDVDYDLVLSDLTAEGDQLDALVAAGGDWTRPTPAVGRTIAHQIAHLRAADANVLVVLRTPGAFDAVTPSPRPFHISGHTDGGPQDLGALSPG
ncbi:hypothetical protein G3I60_04095 [Streptomyces sp. SID13666]|nr:hypothetical protein [Streptomyces sp. SID13666]NEA69309.1 hypothetical protein [Streptomyces sp. SID13588]